MVEREPGRCGWATRDRPRGDAQAVEPQEADFATWSGHAAGAGMDSAVVTGPS
jgi:hypothetical protein